MPAGQACPEQLVRQVCVGTPTLVSGIRSLRNNRSQQTVPQPSPNGPRTNNRVPTVCLHWLVFCVGLSALMALTRIGVGGAFGIGFGSGSSSHNDEENSSVSQTPLNETILPTIPSTPSPTISQAFPTTKTHCRTTTITTTTTNCGILTETITTSSHVFFHRRHPLSHRTLLSRRPFLRSHPPLHDRLGCNRFCNPIWETPRTMPHRISFLAV